MKKILCLTLIIVLSAISKKCVSQSSFSTYESINLELRSIFSPLANPIPSVKFLYEMAMHSADSLDSVYFCTEYNPTDTIHRKNWYEIYNEMRNSAYDTSYIIPMNDLKENADRIGRNDTVVIGIMNVLYNTFIDTAFKTEGLFFNSTDSTVSDVSGRPFDPYTQKTFFLASTLKDHSTFVDVVFKIDTNFLFVDENFASTNQYVNPNFARWKIDFGDGNGWVDFNPLTNTNFNIQYPNAGLFDIKVGILECDPYPYCNNSITFLSKTSILILTNENIKHPDEHWDENNYQVGVYHGCEGESGVVKKALIFVEGFDILDNVSIEENYLNAISRPKIEELLDYGYDIYIVNWKNPYRDLKDNAMDLVALIENMKSLQTTNDLFVIYGESMGGVIARYSLTYMETSDYLSNGQVLPEKMHNTRLLITNDSPHQGAYVPLAMQKYYSVLLNSNFYRTLKQIAGAVPFLDMEKYFTDFANETAVKQLLLMGPSGEPHSERQQFLDDLIDLNTNSNGYPVHCKLLALSSGLLTGQNQIGYGNHVLTGGENIVNFSYVKEVKIFWFVKFTLIDYTLIIKGIQKNVSSQNLVIENYGSYLLKLRGCLRYILRRQKSNYLTCALSSNSYINTGSITKTFTENYETVPGGNINLASFISDVPTKKFNYFIIKGDITLSPSNGEVSVNLSYPFISYLTLGYRSRKDAISLKLNSFVFSFVPVKSAIDNSDSDFNRNYLDNSIFGNLFNESPFDVIMGFQYFNEDLYGYPNNINPLAFRRLNYYHTYFDNLELNDDAGYRVINREIGDRVLYINNLNLGNQSRNVRFTAVDSVHYGVHNPYYESSINVPDQHFRKYTAFTRLEPFAFQEPTSVLLEANLESSFIEGEDANLDQEGSLSTNVIEFEPCNNIERPSPKTVLNEQVLYEKIILYPNPFENELNIGTNFDMYEGKIAIFNSLGQVVYTKCFDVKKDHFMTLVLNSDFIKGVYTVKITSNKNITTYKVIKK